MVILPLFWKWGTGYLVFGSRGACCFFCFFMVIGDIKKNRHVLKKFWQILLIVALKHFKKWIVKQEIKFFHDEFSSLQKETLFC